MLTLRQLASHKRLPVDFLTGLGLCQCSDGVEMPYYDLAGEHPIYKLRTALSAKDGSQWPKGLGLRPYGEWRSDYARKSGEIILVEGESDCWAMWYHGYPALGLPGSGAADCLTVEHIYGLSRIWIHREPDQGGRNFLNGIVQKLADLEYHGFVQELRMLSCKDPSDLHVRCINADQDFKKAFEYLKFTAPWVDMAVAHHIADLAKSVARLEDRVFRRHGRNCR